MVFAWFVLSLQNWIDQIKFWKVTGNSTVSYVALNTVQSSEGAQSDTGSEGEDKCWLGQEVERGSGRRVSNLPLRDLTSPLAALLSVHEGKTGLDSAAS